MSDELRAYCVKCKVSGPILDPVDFRLKNGKPCVKGFCRECLGKVFRIHPTTPPLAPR